MSIRESHMWISVSSLTANPSVLKVRGWCLTDDDYNEIKVSVSGVSIAGESKRTPRPDIAQKYPEYENDNAGFEFEAAIDEGLEIDTVEVVMLCEGKEIVRSEKAVEKLGDVVAESIELLRDAGYTVVEKTIVDLHPAKVCDSFRDAGFNVVTHNLDFSEYDEWFTRVDYPNSYPNYTKVFGEALQKKSLQHYLSLETLGLSADSVVMDVASSISVFPDILHDTYNIDQVWRQDLGYSAGIDGDRIGSFASSIPLSDDSLDAITLHCSLEHFEDDDDFKFFKEALRILRPGGRVCIIPLYMADDYIIGTSPSIWHDKYAAYTSMPGFDKNATIQIIDHIKQRQSKHFDVAVLEERLLKPLGDQYTLTVHFFENYRELKGCPTFALIARKND